MTTKRWDPGYDWSFDYACRLVDNAINEIVEHRHEDIQRYTTQHAYQLMIDLRHKEQALIKELADVHARVEALKLVHAALEEQFK